MAPVDREPVGDAETEGEDPAVDSEPVELVDAHTWLVRASLDLRGVRPSRVEMEAVAAEPDAAGALIDGMVEDHRVPMRMAWLWNDVLHTGVFGADYRRFGWDTDQWRSMGLEPLQVIATVIEEDLPFTEVVTRDQTRANGVLGALYNLPVSGEAWQWVPWTDGRPAAGILSSSTFWLRYTADSVNYNRSRANTLADVFLCADFLDRDSGLSFSIGAEALARVERAVVEEPACVTCHASLDPLAAYMGGFAERSDVQPVEQYVAWSPLMADWYATRVQPSYYGLPAADLGEVGDLVAQDPRFARCATRRFRDGLVGRLVGDEPGLDQLSAAFVGSGFDVRSLVTEIVHSDAYRAEGERVLTTEQLHTSLADQLGLDPDGPADEGLGPLTWSPAHRILGGGTDDIAVLQRNRNFGLGPQVLLAWTARQVVPGVVARELTGTEEDRVLLTFDITDTDEQSVRSGLATLHAHMLSEVVATNSEEIDRLYELWLDMERPGQPAVAWEGVVMALVRHPAQVVY